MYNVCIDMRVCDAEYPIKIKRPHSNRHFLLRFQILRHDDTVSPLLSGTTLRRKQVIPPSGVNVDAS